jgi:hypothetical protein
MSRRSAPSPIKSFVDLACGAFGSVMLLAVVLVQASPRGNQTDEVSGMIEARLWAGYHPEILKKRLHVQLEIDGKKITDEVALKDWMKQSSPETEFPRYEVSITAAEDSTIRLDVRVGRLTSPLELVLTLSDEGAGVTGDRGALSPLLMSPLQPEITVLGDVWHPDLVDRLEGAKFAPIIKSPAPHNGPLIVRILFDPQNRNVQKGFQLEAKNQWTNSINGRHDVWCRRRWHGFLPFVCSSATGGDRASPSERPVVFNFHQCARQRTSWNSVF